MHRREGYGKCVGVGGACTHVFYSTLLLELGLERVWGQRFRMTHDSRGVAVAGAFENGVVFDLLMTQKAAL